MISIDVLRSLKPNTEKEKKKKSEIQREWHRKFLTALSRFEVIHIAHWTVVLTINAFTDVNVCDSMERYARFTNSIFYPKPKNFN